MRPIILKLLLPVTYLLFAAQCYAQTCTGSLGDPVINETFGAGTAFIGPALSSSTTDLGYYNSVYPCPSDGTYTIMSTTSGCFSGTWHSVYGDHTGNPNGYMMLINANDQPSTFFTQKADGNKLCPNTTYEFAAWILNLLKDEPETYGYVQPNITFSIEKKDGTVLKTYNTGNIAATKSPVWIQYGTFFTSPSDGSDVYVRLINNTAGSNGNDFALDDITFKPCGPIIETGFGTLGNTVAQNQCANTNSTYTFVARTAGV